MDVRDEQGAADSRWVLQLVVVFAILGVIGFEIFQLSAAGLGADNAAGDVLAVAEDAYGSSGRIERAREAAQATADELGVELLEVTLDGQVLEVTVRRTADTLLVHRIVGTDGWVSPAGTRSTGVRP